MVAAFLVSIVRELNFRYSNSRKGEGALAKKGGDRR
jgi:hypothetical protein